MSTVPTIDMTTMGVAPMPAAVPSVLAVAMPGFSALLASAAAAPSLVTAMATPLAAAPLASVLQSSVKPMAGGPAAPPPAQREIPSATSDDAKLVSAAAESMTGAVSAKLVTTTRRVDQPGTLAPIEPDSPAPVARPRTDDDQPVSDRALTDDIPAGSGAALTLAIPMAAATSTPEPLPSVPKDPEAPSAPAARDLAPSAPMEPQKPTRIAPALSGLSPAATPALRHVPATLVASVQPLPAVAPVRAAGGDHLATPGLPPLLSPRPDTSLVAAMPSAASVATATVSAMAATPVTIVSQTVTTGLLAPAGLSAGSLPSAAVTPAIVALPGLAIAARPSGNVRLPRALESDDRVDMLTIATTAETQRPFGPVRADSQAVAAPRSTPVTAPEPAATTDIVVSSDRLGLVRIGIEDAPGDLRVSLGLSPAAAVIVAADAPRLLADLAAGGVRLQSLDLSGNGFAGGHGPSQGAPQHQPQPASRPRPAITADINPLVPVRARTADRYA